MSKAYEIAVTSNEDEGKPIRFQTIFTVGVQRFTLASVAIDENTTVDEAREHCEFIAKMFETALLNVTRPMRVEGERLTKTLQEALTEVTGVVRWKKGTFALAETGAPGHAPFTLVAGATRAVQVENGLLVTLGLRRDQIEILRAMCDELLATPVDAPTS